MFASFAHWIYATKFFEVVLFFPLFLDPNQVNREKKQKKARWILFAANAFFLLQVAIWAGFMFAYSNIVEKESYDKAYTFDALNKFFAVILLATSILVLRRDFSSKQAQKVFAKEKKIVLVHLVIFLSASIVFATFLALNSFFYRSDKSTVQYCRLYVADNYFFLFFVTGNIVQIILFTFMSVRLSQPLTGYWVEFLLIYRS